MSRAEAKAAGLKRYFTGKPCKHGHVAERFASSNNCIECGLILDKRRYKENPKYRAAKRARVAAQWATQGARAAAVARYANDPDFRAAKRAWATTPEGRAAAAARGARLTAKRQAKTAAKIATEMFGIPHTVVKMEDGTFHVQLVPVTK